MRQRIHGWPILLGMALFIILSMGNLGLHSCLAQGEETISQIIPNLVVVDALDAAILAADATYLYGSSGNRYSILARFGTQDHQPLTGYDFGEGTSIGRVWTTSVEGEVFAVINESASETADLYRSTDYGDTFTKVLVLGDDGFGGRIPEVTILHHGFYEAMLGSSRKLLVGEYNVNRERISGSTNDQVRIMQSTDGETWTLLYTFNTGGVHQTRHIHVITQDPISGWIYFGLGDSRAESAILAWDGVVAWPEEKLALSEFRGLEGFYASSSSSSVPRVIVTDLLFPPHDDFLYVGIDDYPSSIQRYSRDLTFNEQVYPTVNQSEYNGSIVRLGVIATGPNGGAVQIWHDTGNAATNPDRYDPPSNDNFVTFYVSREDSFAPGAWDAVGRYNLWKLGKQVPRNFLVHNNRIYFSAFSPAGKGQSLTAVFQVGGEFSGERLETISPAFWIATDGDDGNDGGSVSTPWQTVTRLADQAVTYGSIVLIAAGQYPVANDLSLDFSNGSRPGPAGLEVMIRGEGPGVTTVAFGPSATQGFQSKESSSDRFVLEMLTTTGNWGANHYGSVAADTILGGSGIDTLYGYAGDDILDGGQGDDRLIGGSGKDTFLFTGANGMDTIADFELSSDFIRLVGYGIGNPNDLFITQQGPDAVIDLTESGGGRITLVGIDATQLGNSHFAFE